MFLILVACPPCAADGQGRVTEVEVLGIAVAEGGAALQGKLKPPLRLAEVAPEDEGGAPDQGWHSIHQGVDLGIISLSICLS